MKIENRTATISWLNWCRNLDIRAVVLYPANALTYPTVKFPAVESLSLKRKTKDCNVFPQTHISPDRCDRRRFNFCADNRKIILPIGRDNSSAMNDAPRLLHAHCGAALDDMGVSQNVPAAGDEKPGARTCTL